MTNYHLTPDGDRWTLLQEGSNELIGNYATKEEALDRCSIHMAEREGSLKIHRGDGTVEEERTYPIATEGTETSGDAASGGVLNGVQESFQDKVIAPVKNAVRDGIAMTGEYGRRAAKSTDQWIGQHPYPTAGFAFIAGILIGIMVEKHNRW